jgi:Homeodomain
MAATSVGKEKLSSSSLMGGLDAAGKYVRYTPEQVEALERVYNECPKPSSLRRQQLIRECPILSNIEPKQIKVWFQNRRFAFLFKTLVHHDVLLVMESPKLFLFCYLIHRRRIEFHYFCSLILHTLFYCFHNMQCSVYLLALKKKEFCFLIRYMKDIVS